MASMWLRFIDEKQFLTKSAISESDRDHQHRITWCSTCWINKKQTYTSIQIHELSVVYVSASVRRSAKKMWLRHYLVSTIHVRQGQQTDSPSNLYRNIFLREQDGRLKCQAQRAHNENLSIPFPLDVLQSFIVMLPSRFDGQDWDEIAASAFEHCAVTISFGAVAAVDVLTLKFSLIKLWIAIKRTTSTNLSVTLNSCAFVTVDCLKKLVLLQ